MFRVELMCDDKRLPLLLRAIQGLATVVGCPQPVVNAEIANGKITAKSNGSASALFAQYLAKHKITEVNASVAKAFLQSVGRSPQSANYLLTNAAKQGVLRLAKAASTQKGKGALYAVQHLLPPPTKRRSKATAS